MAQLLSVISKQKVSLQSLDDFMDKRIAVECVDGRVVRCELKGFDSNLNLVVKDALVVRRGAANPFSPQITGAGHPDVCRVLGAVVIRGSLVLAVYRADGATLVSADPLAA